jgi:hypothetical protein
MDHISVGKSDNYINVYFGNPSCAPGETVNVRIHDLFRDGLTSFLEEKE